MQFALIAAVAALAGSAAAWSNSTVDYVTETYTAYTTVCPASTTFSFNGVTYTATESETITITNCPCTVTHAVTTTSSVATTAPVYKNTTSVGTTSTKATSTPTPSTITASSGNKLVALSGASLAGLVGVAAYFL